MIRYATSEDVPTLAQLIHKFWESPVFENRMYDAGWIEGNLKEAEASDACDVVICEVDGVWLGAACACQQPTMLCPEWEYHEQFIVALDPSCTRSLIRWLVRRGKERKCFRTVIGSTSQNTRYEKVVQIAGVMQPYGVTFVKEYDYAK